MGHMDLWNSQIKWVFIWLLVVIIACLFLPKINRTSLIDKSKSLSMSTIQDRCSIEDEDVMKTTVMEKLSKCLDHEFLIGYEYGRESK